MKGDGCYSERLPSMAKLSLQVLENEMKVLINLLNFCPHVIKTDIKKKL